MFLALYASVMECLEYRIKINFKTPFFKIHFNVDCDLTLTDIEGKTHVKET